MNKVQKSLAIATGKGGVGKTLLATSLPAIWVEQSYRILVVDCDAQGSATRTLGVEPEAVGRGIGLYDSLVRGEPLRTAPSPGRDGLHVVPAGIDTRHVESALVNMSDGQQRFSAMFNEMSTRWDRIVFDLPPSVLGKRLSEIVLSSSQFLVAPCTDTPDDIEGLRALGDLNRELHTEIVWLGVALVRIAVSATRRRTDTLNTVRSMLDGEAEPFDTIVRTAGAAYSQAREANMLPHEYARYAETLSVQDRIQMRGGPARNAGGLAEDLLHLADEVWERLTEGDTLLEQISYNGAVAVH